MAAWTEAEKANIRAYLGFPALFHQIEPRLENAINAVQAVADGGVLPSTATQDRMRTVLASLASIDAQITSQYPLIFVSKAGGSDSVNMDAARAVTMLKIEGRRLITQLSIPLGCAPVRDYYSATSIGSFGGNTFIAGNNG